MRTQLAEVQIPEVFFLKANVYNVLLFWSVATSEFDDKHRSCLFNFMGYGHTVAITRENEKDPLKPF